MNGVRNLAIQDTALSVGAQAGLACRSKQINLVLAQHAKTLDQIFNFNLMMLPHNVLPPVLDQSEESLNLADNNTIRIADRTYQIVSQARFVTVPPTWRDYLWLSYTQPQIPVSDLLPKNAEERSVWRCYAAIGWKQGITQANEIYATNLARLKRDYLGMVRYRVLLNQGMVSAPYVARTDLGVTGNSSTLRINDQVLRITALPSLQTNSRRWKTVVVDQ
jgi:defect-in-organelle-trafficking protein DotC